MPFRTLTNKFLTVSVIQDNFWISIQHSDHKQQHYFIFKFTKIVDLMLILSNTQAHTN